ncbi:MAG TPA: hypothetical protein VMQ60_03080 [Acidobacteriaceae bacterium]|jgi:hypothetical protein|nr:hypothetical protein [Acidobacteriaceae bacterium]
MQTAKTNTIVRTGSRETGCNSLIGTSTPNATVEIPNAPWQDLAYDKLRARAQQLANTTGKVTCIYERYLGYKVGVLTEKTVDGCQETFDPGGAL